MAALRTALLFFGLAAAVSGAGCHRDRCTPTCEQRVKELGCHPEDPCKKTCEKLHAMPSCKKELQAFEDCFLAKPKSDWVCDLGDGTPVVREDLCLQERQAVSACLSRVGSH